MLIGDDGEFRSYKREFGTMTRDIKAMWCCLERAASTCRLPKLDSGSGQLFILNGPERGKGSFLRFFLLQGMCKELFRPS
jgi:hypothetical protein